MDPIRSLGKILTDEDNAQRDAVHIAVMPVTLGGDTWYRPGDSVRLLKDGKTVRACDADNPQCLGVIDPFIVSDEIVGGDRVFVFLKPGSITGLRHEWSHPLVSPPLSPGHETAMKVADKLTLTPQRELIENFADNIDLPYDDLMGAAADFQRTGSYLTDGTKFEGISVPDGFWEAYEFITGTQVSNKNSFFSCSC
jgi:hypothetical protein